MSVRSLITSNEQYLRYQKNVIIVYLKITIYDVDDLFFVYIGNQNLLSKHDMWQSLLQFYKENNCVVNESDWPWSMHLTENLMLFTAKADYIQITYI